MRRFVKFMAVSLFMLLAACEKEQLSDPGIAPKIVLSGAEDGFSALPGEALFLSPVVAHDEDAQYQWIKDGEAAGQDLNYTFQEDELGDYDLSFVASNSAGSAQLDFQVRVYQGGANASVWIHKVLEYKPAPGAYQNKVESIADEWYNVVGESSKFLSLGTFGGFVSFAFDHSIENGSGSDLAIFGNSFEGSSEPAAVQVAQDLNGNGLRDENEPWLELVGSEYNKESTLHGYKITYYRPEPGHDSHLIKYKSEYKGRETQGELDFSLIKDFHPQSMFPELYFENEATFAGSLIASNSIAENEVWINPKYDFGYADNRGYEGEGLLRGADLFDISTAVNEQGESVDLERIDFVRVYSCTMQMSGRLGERSPEIFKAADLRMLTNE